ncbi:MAG TPA: hypothetical protein VGO11_04415 [Chthoniobacteraceae bacterium]|jgi:hypothetical protein|nr:hypothetical protein [Chthoniobacteraceae bacterium]
MHPDYLHVLLNPIPVYGLAMGLLALFIALGLRSRPAQVVALTVIGLSAAAAWPVLHYGEKAYDDVMMLTDDPGTKWMDDHRSRAEKSVVGFYILAALSLAALVVPRRWPRAQAPLTVSTLVLGVLMLGVGAWIAYAGGRIRHDEFRGTSPPPAAKAQAE